MLDRQFVLRAPQHAASMWAFVKKYAQACAEAGMPLAVTITEYVPSKTRDQEKKYHAMFHDIAEQCQFMGQKQDDETWKRLLVDAFAKIKRDEGDPLPGYGRVIPSLDGQGVVQLGFQTRRFRKKHAAEFIEYLYAWGTTAGVEWTEPETVETE